MFGCCKLRTVTLSVTCSDQILLLFQSLLVEFDEVLYLVFGHGFGDEGDIDLLAFLQHPFRASRSASVDIHLDVRVIFEDLVHRDHEAAEKEGWIVQVNKDESIRLFLLDRSADGVDSRLLKERFIALEAKSFLKERKQVRAGDKETLWIVA